MIMCVFLKRNEQKSSNFILFSSSGLNFWPVYYLMKTKNRDIKTSIYSLFIFMDIKMIYCAKVIERISERVSEKTELFHNAEKLCHNNIIIFSKCKYFNEKSTVFF